MSEHHMLTLTDKEVTLLDTMIELFIRLGLGQVSEIATHINLLTLGNRPGISHELMEQLGALEAKLLEGKPWKLEDPETPATILMAFAIQSKLNKNQKGLEWALRRLREKRGESL